MQRRAVCLGMGAVLTAGCTDRLHDLGASTPSDLAVRSMYVPGDPFADSSRIGGRAAEPTVHAQTYVSAAAATGELGVQERDDDTIGVRSFLSNTDFVEDGGRAVLLVVRRLTSPDIDLRLGAVTRTSGRSIRVAVDEVGGSSDPDADPVVQALFVRLVDDRGAPERIAVSVDGERIAVTV